MSAQWASGFGLKKAVRERAEAAVAKEESPTPEKTQRWEMKVGMEEGKLQARTTPWLRLCWLLQLTAVFGAGVELLLVLRRDKPAPRIGVSC